MLATFEVLGAHMWLVAITSTDVEHFCFVVVESSINQHGTTSLRTFLWFARKITDFGVQGSF